MVMKDKLVKTNHKGPYYLTKKLSFVLLAVASAAFIIAIPTYITQVAKKNQVGLAQETSSEIIEGSEELEEYESYSH